MTEIPLRFPAAGGEQVVPDPVRWVLAGSFAAVLLLSGLAELALEPMLMPTSRRGSWLQRDWLRLGLIHVLPAALSLLVALLAHNLPAISLLIALLAVGLLAVLLGEFPRASLQSEPTPARICGSFGGRC